MTRTFEEHQVNLANLTADELERRANRMLEVVRGIRIEAARASELIVNRGEVVTPVAPAPVAGELVLEPQALKPPERSVGKLGIVTFETAKARAEDMGGGFTRAQFADRIGLKGAEVMRWIARLVDKDVIVYHDGAYRCVNPPTLHHWVIRQREPFTVQDAAKVTGLTEDETLSQLNTLELRGIARHVNGSGLFEYEPTDPSQDPRVHPHPLPPEKEPPSFTMAPRRGEPVRKSASDRTTRAMRSKAGAGGIKGPKQRDARYNKMQEAKAARAASSRRAGQAAQENGKGSPRSTSKRRKAA